MEGKIVKHCAPTLAGLKCGCLFKTDGERTITEQELNELNTRLNSKGIFITSLGHCGCGRVWYVYRKSQLSDVIRNGQTHTYLKEQGFECEDIESLLEDVRYRIAKSGCLPHEIGILLKYPLEDVQGFIRGGKDHKCIGCWKVYGNVEEAHRAFTKIKKCKAVYQRKYEEGSNIEKLAINA